MPAPREPDGGVADMKSLARQERAELAAFLDTLTPAQWNSPTLCAGWTVRDVVAHMFSFEELDWRGLLSRFAKGWFLPNRINAIGLAEYATRTPEELLALINAHLEPRGLTTAFGGMIALVDSVIHHQDIRRPLGLPRQIPEQRLRRTLRGAFVAPPVGAFWCARGLRLIATDIDFSTGKGPEVHGTGEAILMAVAGRRGVAGELTGPGQSQLLQRIGG